MGLVSALKKIDSASRVPFFSFPSFNSPTTRIPGITLSDQRGLAATVELKIEN